MNYLRKWTTLPLPLAIASIICICTVGIVVASFLATRIIHVNPMDGIVISGEDEQTIGIIRGSSENLTYDVTNNGNEAVNMAVVNAFPDPNVTIECMPSEFTVDPGETVKVNACISVNDVAGPCTLTLQFQQTS